MTDDRLLAEILRSPLDDMPKKQVNRSVIFGVAFAAVVLVSGAVLMLRSGDDVSAPPTTSPAATDGSEVTGAAGAPVGVTETTTPVGAAIQVYPEPSAFHEMVALGDGRLLLFGGLIPLDDGTLPLEGTWMFDATVGEWTVSHPVPAPSPRFGHAMALHPPTGIIVLFGGGTTQPRRCPRTLFCTGPEDNQVWHYDPVAGSWAHMTPPVPDEASWPVARFGVRFAYEPVTERFIMFSGVGVFGERFTPTYYEDTWAYDPVTNEWENLTSADDDAPRPIGRTTYGFGWNEEARRVMLFAGDSLSGTDDDHLWAFDPETSTWEDRGVAEMGPFDRWFHLLTTDPQSGRLVLIGGSGSILTPIQGGTIREVDALDEVWTWSEAEGWIAQNRMEAPMGRVSGAGDPATLGIIAYGGGDVMSYDSALDVWSVLAHREQSDDG
ncbi:MAG: hypothetical protein V3S62_01015 [Acidimicrobiia bacterium]